MKLRELIFSRSQWTSKTLWDNIQTELGGLTIYIQKIDESESQYRNDLIRKLFYKENKSVRQLAEEFNLCERRVMQIVRARQRE